MGFFGKIRSQRREMWWPSSPLVLIGFLVGWLPVFLLNRTGEAFPLGSYMQAEGNAFNDFYFDRFENYGTYAQEGDAWGYLTPVGMFLGQIFGRLDSTFALVLFLTVATVSTAVLAMAGGLSWWESAIIFSSFPFWFAVSRGNNDLWLVPFTLLFLICLKFEKRTVAALVLAFVVALEPVFGVFFLGLIRKGAYRPILVFLVSSLLLWLSPMQTGEQNLTRYFSGFLRGLDDYRAGYVLGDAGFLFSNSLWAPTKLFVREISGNLGLSETQLLVTALSAYSFLLPAAALVSYYFSRRSQANFLLENLAYVLVILTFGPVTATYKLGTLVVFLACYLAWMPAAKRDVVGMLFLISLPKAFYSLQFGNGSIATLDTFVNPALLLLAVIVVLKSIIGLRGSQTPLS